MPWKWLNLLFMPRWDWIQVEVSTHCNAACLYCPHTVYRDRWIEGHMSLSTFKNLVPVFSKSRMVYLQGWGEPFLNPDFFSMVALAKEAGCRVGTTTNGMLLEEGKIRQAVVQEVDVVALSLAGSSAAVNDHYRRGTCFRKVLAVLESFQRIKEEQGRLKPEIHVAYLLLHSGWPDLERLPLILEGSGVSQVVISPLDFVPAGELAGEAIRPRELREYEEMQARLQAVAVAGAARGLNIQHNLQQPGTGRLTCTENPGRGLVVAADGGVSPCVFANLPPGMTYFAGGRELPYQPLSFGNINAHSLADIWNSKAYAAFRHAFETGRTPAYCQHCSKLWCYVL